MSEDYLNIGLDDEWNNFCGGIITNSHDSSGVNTPKDVAPECSDIYISTKTKIAYLNQKIDLGKVFWKLPVVSYHVPTEGIIKKQMKFNSTSEVELSNITTKIPLDCHVDQFIITQIINPDGRIKFRDVRKISIGLCKKDIISYRGKQKGAFYNCFVLILRILHEGKYREIHVKIFNTGKLEIPGMRDDKIMKRTLEILTSVLNNNCKTEKKFECLNDKCDTVLINSNFRCGYYLNRESLYNILKDKYRINCSYDSCSYPGIQCEFYYDPSRDIQTGQQPVEKTKQTIKVSFMIFRTGSALIVGKCCEDVLQIIYEFICNILKTEYPNISRGLNHETLQEGSVAIKKTTKKTITVNI